MNRPFPCLAQSCRACALGMLLMASAAQAQTSQADEELSTVTVVARRVANEAPAAAVATPITLLRYDPQLDVQSRGIAETQGDLTVRGGVFENTGFKLGPLTLFDPQTGHYSAELPLDPAVLTTPMVLTGIANALAGFNSAVATVDYGLTPVTSRDSVAVAVGSDDFWSVEARFGHEFSGAGAAEHGLSVALASAAGNGSLANGDHELDRVTARWQRRSGSAQTDVLMARQDKFYGWPGAYTGFATLPETDETETSLLFASHRVQHSASQWWEVGAYLRTLDDDYDFDRRTAESGTPGSFEHETESYAVGWQASTAAVGWQWRHSGQLTGDRLVRSTDLIGGDFDRRRYATLSVVPSRTWRPRDATELELQLGATWDWSNRDDDALLPLAGLALTTQHAAATHRYAIEYAASSQLPGYTALKSGTSGLFGGNPELGRERADTLALTISREAERWQLSLSLFHRRDDDLVDWTFAAGSPFVRQANPVDLDVTGAELIGQREFGPLTFGVGYTYLDKSADYAAAAVDASYYALNYARHRLTAATIWRPREEVELRMDAQARQQEDNVLRDGGDDALKLSAALIWRPSQVQGLRFDLVVDNLTDDDFEQFPGTPAARRQASLRAGYSW